MRCSRWRFVWLVRDNKKQSWSSWPIPALLTDGRRGHYRVMATKPRKGVSGKKRLATLQEAFSTCPFCGLELIGSLQVHHIDGEPSNDDLTNLIAPCASCHDQITKGLKSESDVIMIKRMLQAGLHPFRKKSGQAVGYAVHVTGTANSGIIANKVTFTQPKSGQIILPGSNGSEPKKYNYVEYLIKSLTKYRNAGKSFGQAGRGKLHSGGTRKILENQLGGLPKDLMLDQFDLVVAAVKAKIDNTILGKRNSARGIPNYHSFEAHGQPKRR